MPEQSPKQIIDVELLVEELKKRVARERAAGVYADDLSRIDLEVLPPQAIEAGGTHIRFRPELAFSSKPVIGPVITLVKRFFVRLLFFVLDDLARQTDAAVTRLEMAIHAEASAREASDQAEAAAREGLHTDLSGFEQRVGAIRLPDRLARLERTRRPAAAAAAPSDGQQPPAVAPPAFDYESFEARFRPEESVRERQHEYVDLLRGKTRVVDLGCGRGELVEMLNAEGISAYGVEIDPDFVELLQERGVEVVPQDAVSHLAGLEPGAVDGIVASHLVEHLPPAGVTSLVALAGEKLADGGILVLETPNPESLVAGSINFHRDLTHVRPIHPDTLAFLCESGGFAQVEIRRLSPVPEEERLPKTGDEKVDGVVGQINELLYGYQDYAVVARR